MTCGSFRGVVSPAAGSVRVAQDFFAVLLAGAFRVAVFFAAVDRAAGAFVVFLAVVLFAGDFFAAAVLVAGVFFAGAFFAVLIFLAGAFFAVLIFLAGAFLAVLAFFAVDLAVDLVAALDFLAADLLAADVFAVDVFAVDFVVLVFLAGAFFAVDLVAGAFLAADFVPPDFGVGVFLAAAFPAPAAVLATDVVVRFATVVAAPAALPAVDLDELFLADDFCAAGTFASWSVMVRRSRCSLVRTAGCSPPPYDLDNIKRASGLFRQRRKACRVAPVTSKG